MAVLAVSLQILACLGFGGFILRLLKVQPDLSAEEQLAWSFGLGFGVIGWLGFFLGVAGMFNQPTYGGILILGSCGLLVIRGAITECIRQLLAWRPAGAELPCLGAVLFVVILMIVGACAPPSDADSLAYHFFLPKHFNTTGKLEFVPRAVDGAVPMLIQMSYLPALGLGGELGLTLWAAISGLCVVAMVYVFGRIYLPNTWAIVAAILFATTPAFVYGAGSGQVEVRMAALILVAAFSLQKSLALGSVRYALICGICVGFVMASKYTGLIFALSCGLVMIFQRHWFRQGAIFTIVALIFGCQWYVWNFAHTGDPIFPMMYEVISSHVNYRFWDSEQAKIFFMNYLETEKPFSVTLLGFLSYPYVATFLDWSALESSRTGLGPLPFLVLPFFLIGLWANWGKAAKHPLLVIGGLAITFYVVWFFSGSPQRIRHLLPVYPLVLIVAVFCAAKGSQLFSSTWILGTGIILTLLIQTAGMLVFSMSGIRYLVGNETRDQYLERSISGYSAVRWLNSQLSQTDRVYIEQRETAYLLRAPSYLGHPYTQALVRRTLESATPAEVYKSLRRVRVTYLILPKMIFTSDRSLKTLIDVGCIEILKTLRAGQIPSRTLVTRNPRKLQTYEISVARMANEKCQI